MFTEALVSFRQEADGGRESRSGSCDYVSNYTVVRICERAIVIVELRSAARRTFDLPEALNISTLNSIT